MSRLMQVACMLFAASLAAAQSPAVTAVPIPEIQFEGMESDVVAQFKEALVLFQAELSESGKSAAELARTYAELGELFHAYEFHQQALWSYDRALIANPQDFEHLYLAGVSNEALGQFGAAIARYHSALLLRPNDSPTLLRLAKIMHEMGDISLAGLVLDRAPPDSKNQAVWLAAFADHSRATGDLAGAIKYLERAVELQPAATRLNYQLGLAYRELGDEAAARAALGRSGPVGVKAPDTILDRINTQAVGEIANLLAGRRAFAVGDYQSAAAAFGQAVDANRNSVAGRVNLGSTLVQLGFHADAQQQFNAVLRIDPDNLTAIYNLGALSELSGDSEAAVNWYGRALTLSPRDLEIHFRLGRILRNISNHEAAFQHLAEARQDPRYFAESIFGMASIATRNQDYESAIKMLQHAHANLPSDRRIALALAKLLAASPEPKLRDGRASLELVSAANQSAVDAESAEITALALAELGRCDEAAGWVEDARKLIEDNEAESARLTAVAEAYRAQRDCSP